MEEKKKLWGGEDQVDARIEEFTTGKDRDLDMLLARFDVIGSLAHAKMLASIGILSAEELNQIEKELHVILKMISSGKFYIEDGIEDIHSQVEVSLTRKLGAVGKKIHTGRSRNDQVLLDIKMFIRDRLSHLTGLVRDMFDKLLLLSERHKDMLLPGYTHMQAAMPSSFGLWFSAYAESLIDDMHSVNAAYQVVNKNPLGSAAGYGSSFNLDRAMTTRLLGFADMNYSAVYAQMSRGKSELVTAEALASVAATMGKMSSDIILYMCQNFGFVSFPQSLTTGSSIMPHKKNPDVFEMVRAKCNRLLALPAEIRMLTINLPSGYHRDLQLIKEHFFPSFYELEEVLGILAYSLDHIEIKAGILDDQKYNDIFTVEEVNRLVAEGKTFRDAYHEISEKVRKGTFHGRAEISHKHEGSIGNLCLDKIAVAMNRILDHLNFEAVDRAFEELLGSKNKLS